MNPNKTKALFVSRSMTVNPPHYDFVFCGCSIRASPNIDILGAKFDCKLTFEDPVRLLFLVSFRELVFWGWWNVYLWIPRCYFVAVMYLFPQSLSIALPCRDQLLYVTFSFSSARCILWLGFFLIRISSFSPRVKHTRVSRCRTSQFLRYSCRPRYECGMTSIHCVWHLNAGWV